MSNPFAALAGSDSEDDGSAPVTKAAPAKAAPARKAVKGPTKSVPAAESNYRGGGGDYRGDTRASSGRGRGNNGGYSRGGNAGRGSGDAKRSQGKAGNKADEKRKGQGGGNYGSTADDIAAGKAEVDAGAEPRTPKSPAPRDDEPEPEPELPTFTMEEYLAKQNKSSKVGALKLRKAGEGEKSAVKQGDVILKTDLADVEAYGGNDKYGGKTKKLDATRKGRNANANRLLVDIKYAPSDQVESSYAPERASRGGGRGGGRGGEGRGGGRGEGRGAGRGGGGRGRGEGRGRGRGRGEGRGEGRGGRGRGPSNTTRGGGNQRGGAAATRGGGGFKADDFPSL